MITFTRPKHAIKCDLGIYILLDCPPFSDKETAKDKRKELRDLADKEGNEIFIRVIKHNNQYYLYQKK